MTFFLVAFLAGALTVLAPCILPLLPVVIGSSATTRSKFTPYIVVGSLAVSVILFTFLLKASTAFISIPPEVWTYLSGGILLIFGLTLVLPALWERMPGLAMLSRSSNKLVGTGYQQKSLWGDIVIGAALGPVFSTCSPTYFVILASVLPASFLLGTAYLLAYVAGLSIVLLLLAVLGERLVARLNVLADPRGWFKRIIGILFIILGLMIMTGYEKKLETGILESGFFDVTQVEQHLLQGLNEGTGNTLMPSPLDATSTDQALGTDPSFLSVAAKALRYPKAPELVSPDAYLNTDNLPITIAQYKGKKVVLIDFWTYSCINCKRTTPYLNAWYDTYEKAGLVIIGVHTPEFAFEHVKENVAKAIQEEGITYPVVLDNEYATWNAFKNQFWPRKYLIDVDGYIVYDHAGEGAYDETEAAIRRALSELHSRLGTDAPLTKGTSVTADAPGIVGSPETYFGAARNEYLANGTEGKVGVQSFTLPSVFKVNALYFGGTWDVQNEYVIPEKDASLVFRYNAKNVYMVASAAEPVEIEVYQDGVRVNASGADVSVGSVLIGESRLYSIIKNTTLGEHTLELRVKGTGAHLYTFTFG